MRQSTLEFRVRVLPLIGLCVALPFLLARPQRVLAWQQRYSDGDGRAVILDAAGNPIAAGAISSAFTVVKLDAATGSEVWRYQFAPGMGVAITLAQDAAGNVIAAGTVAGDVAVVKLDPLGGELWRRQLSGSGVSFDSGDAVAVDASGDVVVTGALSNGNPAWDLFAAKLLGSDGSIAWEKQFALTPVSSDADGGRAVRIDSQGDVIVGGVQAGIYGIVLKLDGATGAEDWRYEVGGRIEAVALTTSDDAIVAGGDAGQLEDFAVLRLSGASGALQWQYLLNGSNDRFDRAFAVVVDAGGDAIAAGYVENRFSIFDLEVVKLDGGTGAQLWRREINGNGTSSGDQAFSLALDAVGNPVAAGRLGSNRAAYDLFVAKMAAADGAEIWRRRLSGLSAGDTTSSADEARQVVVDAAGNAYAAGVLRTPTANFAVVELGAADGGGGLLSGVKLDVRDDAGDTGRRHIAALSRDPLIATTAAGSVGDPVANGATIVIENPGTAESATFSLPSGASWRVVRGGYAYRDPLGVNGPCRSLDVRDGKKMKLVCDARLAPIPFSLDETMQGALTVKVGLGTASPHCIAFGGTIRADHGTANPGPTGSFSARNAATLAGSACTLP